MTDRPAGQDFKKWSLEWGKMWKILNCAASAPEQDSYQVGLHNSHFWSRIDAIFTISLLTSSYESLSSSLLYFSMVVFNCRRIFARRPFSFRSHRFSLEATLRITTQVLHIALLTNQIAWNLSNFRVVLDGVSQRKGLRTTGWHRYKDISLNKLFATLCAGLHSISVASSSRF